MLRSGQGTPDPETQRMVAEFRDWHLSKSQATPPDGKAQLFQRRVSGGERRPSRDIELRHLLAMGTLALVATFAFTVAINWLGGTL